MKRWRARLRRRWRAIKSAPRRALIWLLKAAGLVLAVLALWVAAYRFVPPPITTLMVSEWVRLGDMERDWRGLDSISPHLPRAIMAAEDARFCAHWGFDFQEIRNALAEDDRRRGASTLTQQVAKNAFLWPSASWTRKGLEAGFTLLIEIIWPKRRVMEVYLNIAEMGEGVFGAEAAARRWYGVSAADLTLEQAARIAAILPNPRQRDPAAISAGRVATIIDGAETLRRDGRANCIQTEE